LVPWIRLKQYRRSHKIQIDQSGGGAVGALQSLLDAWPELRKAFEARILSGVSSRRLVETKQSKRRHCAWFLDQLRGLGYEQRAEWPFNTARLCYVSIGRYVDSVLSVNPRALAATSGGPDLVAKLKTGDGARRPDGRLCVSLPLMGAVRRRRSGRGACRKGRTAHRVCAADDRARHRANPRHRHSARDRLQRALRQHGFR
jgi:hypothetical protein